MRFKLTKELCYFAGLVGNTHEPERSCVGIKTAYDGLLENFIEHAIKLGVDSKKMMIEENGDLKHVYFYHSKIARMVHEILDQRQLLPKKGRELAAAYLAGLFDASGHSSRGHIYIKRMEKGDELMLELMGVHTNNGRVRNVMHFLEMIKEYSFLAQGILSK